MQDYQQAADWLTKAAQQGEPYAQVNLGWLYESGSGVERNPQHAKALYLSASRSDVPELAESARKFAADMPDYSSGQELMRSSEKAPDWVTPVAIGGGALLALAFLFSSPSEHRTGSEVPSSVSSYPTAVGNERPTASSRPAPPTPVCRPVPVGNSMTLHGSNAISPRGATTPDCN